MRALVLVALAGCAVVRPPRVDERPRWRITSDNPHELGCASARALIRKSGKQGIGIALQFKSRSECKIDFTMWQTPAQRCSSAQNCHFRSSSAPRAEREAWYTAAWR